MLDLFIFATSTEPPIAPAAKKYDADEASPSTLIFFGLLYLDEEFKVDGKAVKLIYAPSRRESKCKGTMPIMIEKIK